ncbi:hypothetical protein ACFPOB_30315 [Bosea eneae]|uniref:Uncharacterized protein n=1 Tax=Bosea eneae TaxID=151454 RepID=A0ABW0J219_9HYPH
MRFAFVLALIALAMPALAAEPAPLADGVAGLIQYAASAAAAVVVGLLGSALYRFFGVSLEARHREALHSALTTGAGLALSMIAELIAKGLKPDEARSVALQTGVDYVRQSVPDALKALKPADGLLFDMVRAKSAQIEIARSPAIVLNPPAPAASAGVRG